MDRGRLRCDGSAMSSSPFATWLSAFEPWVRREPFAALLKQASVDEDLRTWTNELTTAVVRSCEGLGWIASARWNPTRRLPQPGQEYLGLDVTAFPGGTAPRWPLPVAVFELENSPSDRRVAYSLWKVLCVRAGLRVVFAYRPDWEQGRRLVSWLAGELLDGLPVEDRVSLGGQTVVVIGNRGEGETFPWGYFKSWLLDANLGRFEKVAGVGS